MRTTPRRSSVPPLRSSTEQRRGDPGKASILVVQHEDDYPPPWSGTWLTEAGCTLEVCHPYAGDAVPTARGVRRAAGLGGAMGANDDELLDWIGPVKELIRDAVAEGVPTLGICLGHQLWPLRSAAG